MSILIATVMFITINLKKKTLQNYSIVIEI